MASTVESHYVQQYTSTLKLLLQQEDSKLSPHVTPGVYHGKQAAAVDQFGSLAAQRVTSRFGTIVHQDISRDRRWILPGSWDLPQLVPQTSDLVKLLTNPMAMQVMAAKAAFNRTKDDLILEAFFNDAKTGVEGGTTTSFGTTVSTSGGQNVAADFGAAANTKLNVAKLREVRRTFRKNQVDLESEQIVMCLDSTQEDALLQETQIASRDYNSAPVLVDGRITRFMGINFVYCERLTTGTDEDNVTTNYQIPAWVAGGIHFGKWDDLSTEITKRNDIQEHPWQIYDCMTVGATRLEEKRVVRVWCAP